MGNITLNKRIEYIDALRGFTMLLVVYSHVSLFMLGMAGSTCFSYNKVFQQFRMPLFFFISGFFFFKRDRVWNWSNFVEFCKKKVTVQIISPFIFMMLYAFVRERSVLDMFLSPSKGGYWFTFALFDFFIAYIAICSILERFGVGGGKILRHSVILGISSMLFLAVHIFSFEKTSIFNLMNILEWAHFRYFIFFVLGTITKDYFHEFERYLDGKFFISIIIVLFVVCQIVYFNYDNKILTNAVRFVSSVTGIIFVLSYFRHNKDVFSSENRLGRTMIYVGKHTLDIYIIHFFFLIDCTKILNDFSINCNSLLEFVTSILISIIVISFCLLLSSVIRQSHVLGKFLFGK